MKVSIFIPFFECFIIEYLIIKKTHDYIFSQVISVNDTNYEEYINNNDFVTLYFHAPWSSDSKKIKNH